MPKLKFKKDNQWVEISISEDSDENMNYLRSTKQVSIKVDGGES